MLPRRLGRSCPPKGLDEGTGNRARRVYLPCHAVSRERLHAMCGIEGSWGYPQREDDPFSLASDAVQPRRRVRPTSFAVGTRSRCHPAPA